MDIGSRSIPREVDQPALVPGHIPDRVDLGGEEARPAPAVRLDPSRLLPPPPASGASFDLTGRVTATASSGLSADVSRSVRFGPEGG